MQHSMEIKYSKQDTADFLIFTDFFLRIHWLISDLNPFLRAEIANQYIHNKAREVRKNQQCPVKGMGPMSTTAYAQIKVANC